jgi:nicotinamidase-related amidase
MKDTALLVIDMQNALIEEGAYQAEATIDRIGGLLAQARATDTPVIFIQHEEDEYPPMNYGAAGWQVHPALAPIEGELALRKRTADSFYETPLQDELRARGIHRLVLTGMQTENCVAATCRSALSHGYDVTLVADAHTTFDTEQLTAAQIIENENAALGQLERPDHAVTVTPSAEITF